MTIDNRLLNCDWGATGATLFVSLADSTATLRVARANTGVTEDPAGSGQYRTTLSIDSSWYPCLVTWDDGTYFAQERLDWPLTVPATTADPLATALPGSYAAGTAGAILAAAATHADAMAIETTLATIQSQTDLIASGSTLSAVAIASGQQVTVMTGKDYELAEGYQVDFGYSGPVNLANISQLRMIVSDGVGTPTTIVGECVGAGTTNQILRFQISRTITDTWSPSSGGSGAYSLGSAPPATVEYGFQVEATMAGADEVVLAYGGTMTVLANLAQA